MLKLAGYRVTGTAADGRFRAIHLSSARRVAIEVCGPDATVAIVLAAHRLDAIRHRGVPRILEHGVLASRETWFAIEQPEGISLAEIMLRRALTASEIAALLRDACAVLAAAHRSGIVHCAIRPETIAFGTGSQHAPVIIGGWGSMRAPGVAADDDLDLSAYAAPELTARFDGRADIYALAAIAYRAFTGRFAELEPVHVPNAPEALSRLLARMLAADPARRPSAPEVQLLATRMLEPDRATAPRTRMRWTPVSGVRALHAAAEIVDLDTLKS